MKISIARYLQPQLGHNALTKRYKKLQEYVYNNIQKLKTFEQLSSNNLQITVIYKITYNMHTQKDNLTKRLT